MKSRNKDRKTHESIIGKIIYGFLLFMPLLAIGVMCGYAIFNKNAYQSYSQKQSNEYTLVDNQSQLIENNIYQFSVNRDIYQSLTLQTIKVEVGSIKIITGTNNANYSTAKSFQVYYNNNQQSYSLHIVYGTNSNDYYPLGTYANPSNISFTFIASENQNNNNYLTNIQWLQFGEQQFLDNVFYYSIDKVQQSPLFNWAEDSAIYTGMTATCNTLNITTPFIPLLMTYWLIISVIYILYDIILVILHIFHKKIHQLEDSF